MDERTKNDVGLLTDFLSDELESRSEIIFNVWADSGDTAYDNMGSAKFCLKELNSCKFDDKVYTDEETKEQIDI